MLPWKSWSPRPIFEQKRVKLKNHPPTLGVFVYNKSNFFMVVDKYVFIGDHMHMYFLSIGGGFYTQSKLVYFCLSLSR